MSLPKLLRAIKHGERTVRLDDGSVGIIPEEWLAKYQLLASLGNANGDHLRFTRPQAGLLDVLLDNEPAMSVDATFARVRQELREFSGVRAAEPDQQFGGELRGYQREGLGWLEFLNRFGLGGCLADDMGLGKTIQVLALLDLRRAERPPEQKQCACHRSWSCRARWCFIGVKKRRVLRRSLPFWNTAAWRAVSPAITLMTTIW